MLTSRLASLILACVLLTTIPGAAFGQDGSGGMRKTTSGGSLDILFDPIWGNDGTVKLNIRFLNPGTDQLHEHQDYDVIIRQEGNQIFSAAAQLNQPLLHAQPGNITIPYDFEQNVGSYTLEVQVLGLGFPPIPINPETATFPLTVTPEFPAGVALAFSAAIAGTIAVTRKLRLF